MSVVEIQGKKVHIDDGSDSVRHAVKYLEEYPDNAKDIFEAAHHDHVNGVTHFTLPEKPGYHGSHHFTLKHHSNGEYDLYKKDQGFLAS